MTNLRADVVRDDEAFAALATEWDELVDRAGIEHPSLAIEASFREGLEAFDLLGSDEPWKRVWTDEHIERRWLFLYRNTPRALAIYYLKVAILPRLKRWRARIAAYVLGPGSSDRAVPKLLKAQP